MSIISLKDISKLYGFGNATTVALDEVSLDIEAGEFVAVMGPSGSGKSTLMHIIALLDKPTHGHYLFDGKKSSHLFSNQRAKIRRDQIGFVFQSFNLLPKLTVIENVALPLFYKGLSRTKSLRQAATVLEQVGLSDRAYFLPHQLSGGQVQRAAIARALINSPSIIIADEPTGNLDSASSLVIMELLSELHKTGHTILMVTHNPGLTRFADRVVYMHDGSIVHDQQTKVGELPDFARQRMMVFPRRRSEDDQARGVSELMKAIPQNLSRPTSSKTRSRVGKKSVSVRGPRRASRRSRVKQREASR